MNKYKKSAIATLYVSQLGRVMFPALVNSWNRLQCPISGLVW